MHRIGDFHGVSGPMRGGTVKRGSGGFTLPGAAAEPAGEAEQAPAATALNPLSLLAIQEAPDDPAERDRQGRRRAGAMLEELAALQRELLLGRTDPARLDRLAALAEGQPAADPVLAEALAAIALRARLEIARYTGRNGGR